jgi:hypothetical protein
MCPIFNVLSAFPSRLSKNGSNCACEVQTLILILFWQPWACWRDIYWSSETNRLRIPCFHTNTAEIYGFQIRLLKIQNFVFFVKFKKMFIDFEYAATLRSILTHEICCSSHVYPRVQACYYTVHNNIAYFRSEQYAGNQLLSFVTHVPILLFAVFLIKLACIYIKMCQMDF